MCLTFDLDNASAVIARDMTSPDDDLAGGFRDGCYGAAVTVAAQIRNPEHMVNPWPHD